jgi:hypothetical protein
MGVTMLVAAVLWQAGRSTKGRVIALATATVLTAMLTPPIRSTPWLDWLPDAIEAYLRPEPGRSTFTIFPWGGFLFGGVLAGVWLDSSKPGTESRRNAWLLAAGVAIGVAGYAAAYLPAIYDRTSYWTSSPTFFFVRLGILVALVPIAFGWSKLWPIDRWSPLREFGMASLFVYWIHVEMVYGVVSIPLHRALTFEEALIGMVVLSAFLFSLVRAKQRFVSLHGVSRKSTRFSPFRGSTAPNRPQSG